MAHYGTLREYRFSADVDDIRGARLYGPDQSQIGKIADVVFDHDSGDIQYLVADIGDRKILLSADDVCRSVVDEDDFGTDLAKEQLERLPAFDEKTLKADKDWREFERRHREAMKQEEERLLEQYKREYEDHPVEHRKGSDRVITPEADEEPAAAGGKYRVSAADLTPERLAGKYPNTANTSAKLTMRPAGTPAHAEDAAGAGVSAPRWTGFQNVIRQNLHELRHGCAACEKAA